VPLKCFACVMLYVSNVRMDYHSTCSLRSTPSHKPTILRVYPERGLSLLASQAPPTSRPRFKTPLAPCAGAGGRRERGTDWTMTTLVSSSAGATSPLRFSHPSLLPLSSVPVWSRAAKVSEIGGLSSTVFSSQTPQITSKDVPIDRYPLPRTFHSFTEQS
jgi:hypothetical protein